MLKNTLQQNQITALKEKDAKVLDTLRYILAQIKNKEIEKQKELSDEEVLQVLRKIAKELKESVDSFEKGGRSDLVTEYKNQLDIVSKYLPPEISEEELKTEIDKIIKENKETYEANPKSIIGICMKQLKDKADPQRIMKILGSL